MLYILNWVVRSTDLPRLTEAALIAAELHGARQSPHGDWQYGDHALSLPFQLSDRQLERLRQPYLWLTVSQRGIDVVIDLTCAEGVLAGPFARENMRRLVLLGDSLYTALQPYFGWGNGTGERFQHDSYDRFLRTGRPIYAQFNYVGPALVDQVDWASLQQRRVAVTRLADGGVRVERAPNGHLPRLDLPADEPYGLSHADLV